MAPICPLPFGFRANLADCNGCWAGAWLKLRNKRHVTSNDYLNWLLVIGIILYYMTVLLAIITA